MNYFPEPFTYKNEIEIQLDLSNYAAKSDLITQQAFMHHNLLKNMI